MSDFEVALREHQDVFNGLVVLKPALHRAALICAESIKSGGKIMFCGNGGSAADAQHLAAELVGRLVDDRPSIAGLALTTDSSALTCIANDYSFEEVFARQVEGLGRPCDVLVGISTSGNSINVLNAVKAADRLGMRTIGFLGRDGGRIVNAVEIPFVVSSATTARIQEAHIFLGHMLCGLIEDFGMADSFSGGATSLALNEADTE